MASNIIANRFLFDIKPYISTCEGFIKSSKSDSFSTPLKPAISNAFESSY